MHRGKNIKFSVILPTYNRATTLPRAIESVIEQKYTNWELIIVDDGSTDNSSGVIQKYMDSDSRIKNFFQKNAGRSAARNRGMKIATGDYICFLDSDDFYNISHLHQFERAITLNEPSPDLLRSRFLTNQAVLADLLLGNTYPFSNLEVQFRYAWKNLGSICLFAIRKEFIKKEEFPEKISAWEDKYFLLSLLLKGLFYQCENPTYKYIKRKIPTLTPSKNFNDVRITINQFTRQYQDIINKKQNYPMDKTILIKEQSLYYSAIAWKNKQYFQLISILYNTFRHLDIFSFIRILKTGVSKMTSV